MAERAMSIFDSSREITMSIMKPFVLIVLIGLTLAGCKAASMASPPMELKLENLLRMPLADGFAPDREIVVSHVVIPPNTTMDRHWHPGEEFHYYLEGKVTIVIDGESSIIGTPGTVGHVPFKKMHTAVTGDQGATVLVFRVHTAGMPVRYLEAGGTADE